MKEKDLKNLSSEELIELLQALTGIDDSLKEVEKKMKEKSNNEKK